MEIMSLLEVVSHFDPKAKELSESGWVESNLEGSNLLSYEGVVEGRKFCLLAVTGISSQDTYQIMVYIVKYLGYNSPAYMTGNYWNCLSLCVYVFFEEKEDARILQVLTDRVIKDKKETINRLAV